MSKHIPVLTYHNICDIIINRTLCPDWITTKEFEKQLQYLIQHKFNPVKISSLVDNNLNTNKNIALTFDDGYHSFYTIVYPLLKKYNIPASIYVPTKFIGETPNDRKQNDWDKGKRPVVTHLCWQELEEMHKSGLIEIGSHSHSHLLFNSIDEKTIEQEIIKSKEIIKKYLNVNPSGFSYPGGHGVTETTIYHLKKHTYKYALTASPSNIFHGDNLYKIPRVEINYQNTEVITKQIQNAKQSFISMVNPLIFYVSKFNHLNPIAKFILKSWS